MKVPVSNVGWTIAAFAALAVAASGCGEGSPRTTSSKTSGDLVAAQRAAPDHLDDVVEAPDWRRAQPATSPAPIRGWGAWEGSSRAERAGPDEPERLPPSARQTREGYWLGAMIGPEDVPTLSRLGIRVVLSAHQPDEETVQLLEDLGIEQVSVPMSDTFQHAETLLEVAERYAPDEIFVHCWHGADRTGVIAAFLLVIRNGWTIPDAFYSVLAPTPDDAAGLAQILAAYDLPDYRAPGDPSVGFYSVAATGANGGLKAHARGYVQLISTTLDAIEQIELARRGQGDVPWDGSLDWLRSAGPPRDPGRAGQ